MSSGPFPKRGEMDGDDRQAVIEVFPKAPALQLSVQVGIGGRQDPDIELPDAVPSDRLDLLLAVPAGVSTATPAAVLPPRRETGSRRRPDGIFPPCP